MSSDPWNPDQYEKFKRERYQPAYDLMDLVVPKADMRVIDLGCGTGELTAALHEHLANATTTGLDRSPAMLEKARAIEGEGLEFRLGDIGGFDDFATYDLIFSNAALQWVPNHADLFDRMLKALKPGGQIAVQVPRNTDHPSQTVVFELGREEPYRARLPAQPVIGVLEPEEYAVLLHRLGFNQIHVRLQVYLHLLESREAVVEWVKGTLLTDYQKALPADVYARFLEEYRRRLMEKLDDSRPYPFTFKRILMHAVA